jgi:hypothetical protein
MYRVLVRLRHWKLAAATLPRLVLYSQQRAVLREMRAFARRLPADLNPPLPPALERLTPQAVDVALGERTVRHLADLTALLDRRSPLGICLRRSLIRYHFLRRAGVPVDIQFGARLADDLPERKIAGHAWLTLEGEPYHEPSENWQGFAVMYSWPESQPAGGRRLD